MKKLSEIFYIYKVDIVNVTLQFFYTIFYSTAHTRLKTIVFLELDLSSDI